MSKNKSTGTLQDVLQVMESFLPASSKTTTRDQQEQEADQVEGLKMVYGQIVEVATQDVADSLASTSLT